MCIAAAGGLGPGLALPRVVLDGLAGHPDVDEELDDWRHRHLPRHRCRSFTFGVVGQNDVAVTCTPGDHKERIVDRPAYLGIVARGWIKLKRRTIVNSRTGTFMIYKFLFFGCFAVLAPGTRRSSIQRKFPVGFGESVADSRRIAGHARVSLPKIHGIAASSAIRCDLWERLKVEGAGNGSWGSSTDRSPSKRCANRSPGPSRQTERADGWSVRIAMSTIRDMSRIEEERPGCSSAPIAVGYPRPHLRHP